MMTEKQLYSLVLKDNAEAIALMTVLAQASQVMDDLIDKDKPVSGKECQALFWQLLVTLPNNPFYQRHFTRLNAVITQALNDYYTANEMEQSASSGQLHIAFVLRDNLAQVLSECCFLIGGAEWLRSHAKLIRAFVHNESYESYEKEHV